MTRKLFASAAPLLVFTCACASTGARPVPRPFPQARQRTEPPEAPADAGVSHGPDTFDAQALVETALSYRGVPYRNGGSDPDGFDCSGFTQYVYAQHGIWLPREVREQATVGSVIPADQIEPGDLIFFKTGSSPASHVAIAVGGDAFVHAPSSTGVVRVEHLSAPYWATRYVSARRMN